MKKSFTLIELIVVIAIIAVLAAVISVSVFKALEKAKITRVIAELKIIKDASGALYADTGEWPGCWNCDFDVSKSFLLHKFHPLRPITNPGTMTLPGWDGPYLERGFGIHPWGGHYMFEGEDDWNGNGRHELSAKISCWCYPDFTDASCCVPIESATKIDQALDDGDTATGDLRGGGNLGINWILQWDLY
jgi:general secretion pathway protein G